MTADMTDDYNTALPAPQEAAFQQWRAALPAHLQSTRDYDLRRAWLADAKEAANGHLTDIGKKPNHITYSTDSEIQPPGAQPGRWSEQPDGSWAFAAGATNLQSHTPDDLLNYFQAFENGKQVDPQTGRVSYGTPNRVTLPSMTR